MKQVHPGTDCNEVRRDVEHIGNDERPDEQSNSGAPCPTEPRDNEFAEALSGRERGAVTDLLHARHQRKGDERHPKHPKAELRTRLRICGDARRVVIRSSGDQSRSERA
jgi:hypothetical protein